MFYILQIHVLSNSVLIVGQAVAFFISVFTEPTVVQIVVVVVVGRGEGVVGGGGQCGRRRQELVLRVEKTLCFIYNGLKL